MGWRANRCRITAPNNNQDTGRKSTIQGNTLGGLPKSKSTNPPGVAEAKYSVNECDIVMRGYSAPTGALAH